MGQIMDALGVRATSSLSLSDLKDPQQWFVDAIGGGLTAAGERVSLDSALTLDGLYAATRNVSEDLGKLTIRFNRREGRRRIPVEDHALWPLLNLEWNDEVTAMAGREATTAHAMLTGGGFAYIERDDTGVPKQLFPVHPTRIKRHRIDGKIWWECSTSDEPGVPDTVMIPDRDMLHIHGLGPTGSTGYSIIQLAAQSIGSGLAIEKFSGAYFGNHAQIGLAIKHPKRLEGEARKKWKSKLEQMHQGAGAAFRVLMLDEGMDISTVHVAAKDAQLIEAGEITVYKFCRWSRIPPHKVQQLDRATFSNIEHLGIEYVGDTLQPWDVRWSLEIARKLFLPEERLTLQAHHNFSALLRGDTATRTAYYRSLFIVGGITSNEIREDEGKEPFDDPRADEPWVQGAMVPMSEADGSGSSEKGTEEDGGAPDKDDPDRPAQFQRLAQTHQPSALATAERVVRREINAIQNAARKDRTSQRDLTAWLNSWYSDHRRYLVEAFRPLRLALAELAFTFQLNEPTTPALDGSVWLDGWHKKSLQRAFDLLQKRQPEQAEAFVAGADDRAADMAQTVLQLLIESVLEVNQ